MTGHKRQVQESKENYLNLVSKEVRCLLGGEWFERGWARVEEEKFSDSSRSVQEFWCGQADAYKIFAY